MLHASLIETNRVKDVKQTSNNCNKIATILVRATITKCSYAEDFDLFGYDRAS